MYNKTNKIIRSLSSKNIMNPTCHSVTAYPGPQAAAARDCGYISLVTLHIGGSP